MTVFWIVAASFVAAALLFVLPPLFRRVATGVKPARRDITVSIYRDEMAELDADLGNGVISPDHHRVAREELERRLLEDVATDPGDRAVPAPAAGRYAGIGVGVAVPLLAVVLYLQLGNPGAITQSAQEPAPVAGHAAGGVTAEQIQSMIQSLAARLEQNPNDAEGWAMLARSYAATGRFQEASRAYGRLNELVPDNPQILADYADVLAMAQGRQLAGAPVNLIQQALKADPNHPKSLALAGSAAFEAKDYAQAVTYWERLLALLQPGSESHRSVEAGLVEARGLAGGASPQAAQTAAVRGAQAAPAGANVSGKVSVSAGLKGKVNPGDTVFIFARPVQGLKMPVAIARVDAGALPTSFTLDDSSAMNPSMKLSGFQEVIVGARVSKTGNAMPQSGDLEGFSSPVKVGTKNIHLVIDKVVP
ncbi:MAG TPA: c-type cytochrome biogenesis protein CcmI [Burkholderiales bacterium]